MGDEYFSNNRDRVGKAKQFEEATFEGLPTYENFLYQYQGTFTINQGAPAEIQLTLPGGHYEIEAITRLYNNSEERVIYSGTLTYYLDEYLRDLNESGFLASTAQGKPYILHFKTMASFKLTREIKFNFGTTAQFGGMAHQPMIMVRRIGAIRYIRV